MKWLSIICSLLFIAFSSAAQIHTPLSEDAKRIKAAYEIYLKHPHASANHLAYIAAFPATKEKFIEVFNDPAFDDLYKESATYVALYGTLSQSYPIQALPKAVQIGKKLVYSDWQASGMQETLMHLAANFTDSFVSQILLLPKKERPGVAKFLADREPTFEEYELLINNLQKAGEPKLAALFIQAREERQKAKQQ